VVIAQPQAGADKSEAKDKEGKDGHQRRSSAAPPDGKPLMEQNGVKQPGDERPDLFGIPPPIASKGLLGINGAVIILRSGKGIRT